MSKISIPRPGFSRNSNVVPESPLELLQLKLLEASPLVLLTLPFSLTSSESISDWRDGPPIFSVQSPAWSANGTGTISSGVRDGRLKFSDAVTGLPVTVEDLEQVGEGVGEVQVTVSTGAVEGRTDELEVDAGRLEVDIGWLEVEIEDDVATDEDDRGHTLACLLCIFGFNGFKFDSCWFQSTTGVSSLLGHGRFQAWSVINFLTLAETCPGVCRSLRDDSERKYAARPATGALVSSSIRTSSGGGTDLLAQLQGWTS
jgi:hypothetical protein